jgi:vitamin B12 transporter
MVLKYVLPTLLSLSAATLSNSQSLTDTVSLPELTISDNRLKTPVSRSSRNISIIVRKQIGEMPARSVQEVLAFTPGIDVRQRGVSGAQADISVRGSTFEQSLLLLNGIKMSDPQTGHHMMNVPLPMPAIDRIEIIKGPASSIFGQNAYAGAINIITNIPDTNKLKLEVFGGDFKMRGGNIYAALPIKNYRQAISLSHDASDGHWYNSDFKVSNIFYEGAYRSGSNNETRVMTGCSNREFGANGFYTNRFPDQWESVQTSFASLQHSYTGKKLFAQARTYYRRNNDEFRLFRSRSDAFRNLHRSDVTAFELNAAYSSALGKTGIGLESREEVIKSSNLGNHSRRLSGIFIEQQVRIRKKTDLRIGVYANYYNEYGWKYFPGAELGRQLGKKSRIYAGIGYSYRIPTYTELYYQDPSTTSNPDLKPEEALSYEAGYTYKSGQIEAELVAFRRETNNLIDYFRPISASTINVNKWTPRNIVAVNFNGIESSLQYTFKHTGSNLYFKYLNVSYNFIEADVLSDNSIETRYALTALRQQLIVRIQTEIFKKFALNVSWRYLERYNTISYQLLDAKLFIGLPRKVKAFIELNNILNTKYSEAGYVQMPGRWLKAGISITVF